MSDTPRIDFYVLETANLSGRLFFACRLAEKAYGLEHSVYAHTGSDDLARQLDEMLWTFRQSSFVPHEILGAEAPRAPVTIGTGNAAAENGELLINLAGQVPAFAKQFARIAEIIDADPQQRAAGRERFRQYREMGFEPVTHNI